MGVCGVGYLHRHHHRILIMRNISSSWLVDGHTRRAIGGMIGLPSSPPSSLIPPPSIYPSIHPSSTASILTPGTANFHQQQQNAQANGDRAATQLSLNMLSLCRYQLEIANGQRRNATIAPRVATYCIEQGYISNSGPTCRLQVLPHALYILDVRVASLRHCGRTQHGWPHRCFC